MFAGQTKSFIDFRWWTIKFANLVHMPNLCCCWWTVLCALLGGLHNYSLIVHFIISYSHKYWTQQRIWNSLDKCFWFGWVIVSVRCWNIFRLVCQGKMYHKGCWHLEKWSGLFGECRVADHPSTKEVLILQILLLAVIIYWHRVIKFCGCRNTTVLFSFPA